MNEDKRKKELSLLFLLGCVLFYLFWFLNDGVIMGADTEGYISFSFSREPAYPIFLAFFRHIFSGNYLMIVVFVQCMLAAYATWKTTQTFSKLCRLGIGSSVIITLIQFGVVLLCRFAAQRRTTYCNEIASEGLAIPLFLLFVMQLLLFENSQKVKNLVGVAVYGILLLLTRKQMYIVIVIMTLVFGIIWLIKRINFRKLIFLGIITIVTFLCSILMDIGYNYLVRGEFMRHTADSSAILITALYTSDVNQNIEIEKDEVQELYRDIMSQIDEQELSIEYANTGWSNLYDHYSDHFDLIAFGVVNPTIYGYLSQTGINSPIEQEKKFGEINDYLITKVVPPNFDKIAKVFGANAITGFCNTVAKKNSKINVVIFMLYFLYLFLSGYLIKKKEGKEEVNAAWIIMVCVCVNVVAVSALIFSQSRYMIYNMPLFYIGLFILLRKVLLTNKVSRLWKGYGYKNG